ncbi:hypothetical protein EYZ11_000238 [Aspergillus tanneri]|uniref:Uncharacterized protein n=1 Tax=Aspergillus tanneri TaxID=1220188 RepID=A0A4S3JXS3_9EURO|nr:hypothetical protein EYZ11_000238 [Aspergillus tanneri]
MLPSLRPATWTYTLADTNCCLAKMSVTPNGYLALPSTTCATSA